MRCLYCDQERPDNEFSQEHLIPKGLGGNLRQNPFAISITCARCNSVAGWFVDAPFIRGHLLQMVRSVELQRFADIERGDAVPLICSGTLQDMEFNGQICDYWIGPAGDQIFHFHDAYPDDPFAPVRTGYPSTKQFDPGQVVAFLQATNPVWHSSILGSIRDEFDRSRIYSGNFDGSAVGMPPVYEKLKERIGEFRASHETYHCKMVMSKVHDHRFLAKLSLGFGAKFLGEGFARSDDAAVLRAFYRERSPDARKAIPFRGLPTLGATNGTPLNAFKWRRGHVVTLLPGARLALIASFFGLDPSVTFITADQSLWQGIISEVGMVYVISPGLKKWVGPISVPDFLAHQFSQIRLDSLDALAQEEDSVTPRPPFHL